MTASTDRPDARVYFRAQAYNNAWANHRLLGACARLSPAALSARRTSFFPTILQTLNHIATVDLFYISALEGACVGPAAFEPEFPYATIATLDAAQRALDRRLIALCGALTPGGLGARIELPRDGWVQRERADRTLLHLFQHQIHHRGQAHAMLAGTDVAPPQLDEFFPGDPRERALRADDMAALGLDEEMIWRDF
ncbi:MAG: DinB family protein [Alphaproteobacteria bacterium]|nr:DinB family protein [Alphaproteobacteria bacterium]